MDDHLPTRFIISDMTEASAREISTWTYEYPYQLYSMDGSDEIINDLMTRNYYLVTTVKDGIFGYFCTGNEGRVPGGYDAGIYDNDEPLDIGLGIHPQQTGKGYGLYFLRNILQWIEQTKQKEQFRLTVALFNERAIKVYRQAEFKKEEIIFSKVGNIDIPFLVMTKTNTSLKK